MCCGFLVGLVAGSVIHGGGCGCDKDYGCGGRGNCGCSGSRNTGLYTSSGCGCRYETACEKARGCGCYNSCGAGVDSAASVGCKNVFPCCDSGYYEPTMNVVKGDDLHKDYHHYRSGCKKLNCSDNDSPVATAPSQASKCRPCH